MPSDMMKKLQAEARRCDVSVSWLVRYALNDSWAAIAKLPTIRGAMRNRTENIIRLCQNLTALLKDQHSGLSTWQEFRARAAVELRDELMQVFDVPDREPVRATIDDPELQAARDWLAQEKAREKTVVSRADAPFDPVAKPAHYNSHPSGIEAIEVCRHMGFYLGNVIKYVLRAPYKGSELQDLKKARWYLDDHIARLEKESDK